MAPGAEGNVLQGHSTVRGSQHDPPLSAPGAIARRFWGDTPANGMPATSSRKHSPVNIMARPRTLRRAIASASAKMPRRLCPLGLTAGNCRDAEWATRPLSAPGALAPRFWGNAPANHMSVTSLREHSQPNQMARHRTLRRAVASASAKMPRRLYILGLTDREFIDAEYADTAYVGAGRPCKALLERRRTSRRRSSYCRKNLFCRKLKRFLHPSDFFGSLD